MPIRESIAVARQQEQESHLLQKYLQGRLADLHSCISLPSENAEQVLLEFVLAYIEQVPDVLDALQMAMRAAQIEKCGNIFIAMAEDFFLQPLELIQNQDGLPALIDEAYVAYRLIEELTDRLELISGCQFCPMDMTFPNIIIHAILGEEFANQLDLAVFYAVEALFENDTLPNKEHLRQQNVVARALTMAQSWPSLRGDSLIRLRLREQSELQALH